MAADTNVSLISPNSVLANALLRTIDLLKPRVVADRPSRIVFVVGTQINGAPHLGTSIVQTSAFLLARLARRTFSIDSRVQFSALDNAPYDVTLDPETHHAFQITYYHALGRTGIDSLVDKYYRGFFESLSDATDAEYEIQTYTEQQSSSSFRAEFLRTLEERDEIRWWLAPSHGVVHVRVPCPQCGWAEKRAERTELLSLGDDGALFEAVCFEHGDYQVVVDPVNGGYLDLATLYRNVIKERACSRDRSTLYVMVKGGDWTYGCQLVDGALAALQTPASALPLRVFTPQVLSRSGAKLSKSLIREGIVGSPSSVEDWMLDTSSWDGSIDDFVDSLIWLVEKLLSDPKHFFRSYTTEELGTILANRPKFESPRVREMAIYKRFFDLIASGDKTVEVRVGYSSMRRIQAGQLIRFTCRNESCLTRVKRVTNYESFDAMFESENVAAVNPHASKSEQLEEIRKIFPAEKEALGVIAIEFVREAG